MEGITPYPRKLEEIYPTIIRTISVSNTDHLTNTNTNVQYTENPSSITENQNVVIRGIDSITITSAEGEIITYDEDTTIKKIEINTY